jgi:hypothetical protein
MMGYSMFRVSQSSVRRMGRLMGALLYRCLEVLYLTPRQTRRVRYGR